MGLFRLASLCGVLLLAVASGPGLVAAGAVAAGTTPGLTVPSGCIAESALGHQTWHGDPSSTASKLADALQQLADSNQSQVAGVAFCSDYSGVVIFVASPSRQLLSAISSAQSAYPDIPVYTTAVAASLTAQLAAQSRVANAFANDLSSVGPDMYTGGLSVSLAAGVSATSGPSSTAGQLQQQIAAAATSNGSLSVPIRFLASSTTSTSATRRADVQPYWMGDELASPNAGGGFSICSAGVPLFVNSVVMVLTAGHCGGTTWYNNNNVFGTLYTKSYPGNAYKYGDFELLQGQTYGSRVYNGSITSNSSLSIDGADWGGRPNGSQLCTSGQTTAQICRYFVDGSYQTYVVEGVTVHPVLTAYHDSTGTGNYIDKNGDQGGDSGGPCYHDDSSGGVIMSGIVSGGEDYSDGTKDYTFTQLAGVRAWNAGVDIT